MKYFLLKYLRFTAICITLSACSNSNPNTVKQSVSDHPNKEISIYKKKSFDSLMSDVEKGMPGLEWYGALVANKAFVEIYEHSSSYFGDVQRLLSKQQFTVDQAVICVFAMQNLNIDDYVKLCRNYIELYDHNKISEDTLELIIIHDFQKKRIIADNYTNPDVIAVLNTIHVKKRISKNFKEMIDGILAGKYYHDTEFRN